MSKYEVIVGNIGTIYGGKRTTKLTAMVEYNRAIRHSKLGLGRGAGEPVTLHV